MSLHEKLNREQFHDALIAGIICTTIVLVFGIMATCSMSHRGDDGAREMFRNPEQYVVPK
jgi:hypothetical protein